MAHPVNDYRQTIGSFLEDISQSLGKNSRLDNSFICAFTSPYGVLQCAQFPNFLRTDTRARSLVLEQKSHLLCNASMLRMVSTDVKALTVRVHRVVLSLCSNQRRGKEAKM